MKTSEEIEKYLHAHIPLTGAMQIAVETVEPKCVKLVAPLEPNINHRNTVFGGSASTLAITSAWSLVHFRLQNEGFACRVVIHKNSMSYDKPILSAFQAVCELVDEERWQKFVKILKAKGKSRISLQAILQSEGEIVGRFEGDFVAIVI